MRIANVIITLAVLAVFTVGIIFLQIFLSKKENKWLGLILPLITFCFSLIALFSIAAYTNLSLSAQRISENGELINEIIESTPKQPIMDNASLIGTAAITFLLYNIPTAVLLAIYFACREKRKRNLALEKMSIQDLG